MDDNDDLLGFGSDEELVAVSSDPAQQRRVDQQALQDKQRGSEGSASWERVEDGSQVDGTAIGEQQQSRAENMFLSAEKEPAVDARRPDSDELQGEAVNARLDDDDDWLMSDNDEPSPVPVVDSNVLSSRHRAAPQSKAPHRPTSPTPPPIAELASRTPLPPPHPPHLSASSSTQLEPFVLPDRLPTIDEFLAARRPVSPDRAESRPQRKDDLFDVAPGCGSLTVGVSLAESSERDGREQKTQEAVQSASSATEGGKVVAGAGKRFGKEEKRKRKKKRKLDQTASTPSVRGKTGEAGAEPSASPTPSQPSQSSTSLPSTTMPSVGDRFPTRFSLLTAVSYASHSLGYTCKIVRYPTGVLSSVKIGCPLHMPAGPNRCPASLRATPKAETGEWEVTMCSMAHNHESKELGEWKAPKERQMNKQREKVQPALAAPGRREDREGSSQGARSQSGSAVEVDSLESLIGSPIGPPDRSIQSLSQSPAPPPPAPRPDLLPFTSSSFATAPLELAPSSSQHLPHSASPYAPPQGRSTTPASLPPFSFSGAPHSDLFGHPRPPPALSQPSLRDTDLLLSLAFDSSTTSAPLLLFPSDSASSRSPQQARSTSPLDAHPPPPPPPALRTSTSLVLQPVHLLPPLEPVFHPAPPPQNRAEPSQAEMDAFFGYKGPIVEPDPDLDGIPIEMDEVEVRFEVEEDGPRFSAEEKGKGRAVEELEEEEAEEEEEENLDGEPLDVKVEEDVVEEQGEGVQKGQKEEPYQLQPIPAVSAETGELLTADEKRLAIIDSLERIAVSILSQLVDGVVPPPSSTTDGKPVKQPQWTPKPIVVKLAKRGGEAGADPSLAQDVTELKTRRLVFPRACGGQKDSPGRFGARELAAFLKVVEVIIDGLKNRSVSTKRDIFYRSVALFVKQTVVDSLVEDIAATLRVRRSDLNVVAASKGLFAGHIKITTTDGIVLEGGAQGALIPPTQVIETIELNEIEWVLIIEKEAVFHTLCSPDFLQHDQLPHGIILTGKGYPDLSTRELVKRLSDDYPSLPLLCLVDSDPHGLEILSTYKYGSSALAFDRANLAVEGVEWMGVKGSEWDAMGVRREELLPLTAGDRKKALKMLKREWWPQEWRRELEYMLHIQRKAEIQVLLTRSSSTSTTYSQHSQSQPSQLSSTSSSSTSNRAPPKLVEYIVHKLMEVLDIE